MLYITAYHDLNHSKWSFMWTVFFFCMKSLRSMKSIQHTLKSTEELSPGSMRFELSLVVAHHTKAGRDPLNLYALLWKQVFSLLWISSKEEMSLNVVECKLCRLISHSTGLIRKMWHLLEKNKGICRSESETFSLFVWDGSLAPGVIYFSKTFRDKGKETITPDNTFLNFLHRVFFLNASQAYVGYLKH